MRFRLRVGWLRDGLLEGQDHTLFRSTLLRVACRLRRLRSNAQQFAVLCQTTLRRIENHVFFVNFGGSGAGGTRADALQCAMKRWHISDLQT